MIHKLCRLNVLIVSLCGTLLLAPFSYADHETPIIHSYSRLVYENYNDSYKHALLLSDSIDAFIDNPNEENLILAKQAWLKARESYGQTEGFRFYEGPIDFVNEPYGTEGPEGRLNAWPLDEAYIDYVADNPNSGIIGNTQQSLTDRFLIQANQAEDESDVSTGYHAIEFLLWGQDQSVDGPGNRPVSDYIKGNEVNERRITYLKEVTRLLVKDLKYLVDAWDPDNTANYGAQFIEGDPKHSLGKMLTGIATLAGFELASERMAVALDSGDQEDEHSCFSDNTHNDFLYNALSIQNVYLGTYGDYKGKGVDSIVAAKDKKLDELIKSNIAQTIDLIQNLDTPIDYKILAAPKESPARAKLEKVVLLLQEQADLIKKAGRLLGVRVEIVQ